MNSNIGVISDQVGAAGSRRVVYDNGLVVTRNIGTGQVMVEFGVNIYAEGPTPSPIPNQMSLSIWDGIGPGLILLGSEIIPKNSKLARSIWGSSRKVMNASTRTSISSLLGRKFLSNHAPVSFLPKATSLGGQLGRAVPVLGWGLTYIQLGYHYAQWYSRFSVDYYQRYNREPIHHTPY